jgi:hypothetical protein
VVKEVTKKGLIKIPMKTYMKVKRKIESLQVKTKSLVFLNKMIYLYLIAGNVLTEPLTDELAHSSRHHVVEIINDNHGSVCG